MELAYTGTVTPITDGRFLLMPPKLDPMSLYTLQHNQYKDSKLFRIYHLKCFDAAKESLPANHTVFLGQSVEVARTICDGCGAEYDPVQAKKELAARDKKLRAGAARRDILQRRLQKAQEAKNIAVQQKELAASRKAATGNLTAKPSPLSDASVE